MKLRHRRCRRGVTSVVDGGCAQLPRAGRVDLDRWRWRQALYPAWSMLPPLRAVLGGESWPRRIRCRSLESYTADLDPRPSQTGADQERWKRCCDLGSRSIEGYGSRCDRRPASEGILPLPIDRPAGRRRLPASVHGTVTLRGKLLAVDEGARMPSVIVGSLESTNFVAEPVESLRLHGDRRRVGELSAAVDGHQARSGRHDRARSSPSLRAADVASGVTPAGTDRPRAILVIPGRPA